MSRFILKTDELITPVEEKNQVAIVIEQGKIKKITTWRDVSRDDEVLYFPDTIAAPGFIDIHTHGYSAKDIMEGEEDLIEISKLLPKHGVTSFSPTIETASQNVLLKICKNMKNIKNRQAKGAKILDLHLEGPYISSGEEAGAQSIDYVREPDIEELHELVDTSGGSIGRITVAPELSGVLDFVKRARELGIIISVGHSGAGYEEAGAVFDAGASICTHLFNGMRSFHHREPGVVGACLLRDDVFAEVIPDMVHLHPATLEMVLNSKGLERTVLITDSIPTAGLPDGEYNFGGQDIIVKDGISRVKDSGRLAGSSLTMDKVVENVVRELGMDLSDAVRMATLNPAKALSLENRGEVKPENDADFTILDSDLNIVATIVDGGIVYNSN